MSVHITAIATHDSKYSCKGEVVTVAAGGDNDSGVSGSVVAMRRRSSREGGGRWPSDKTTHVLPPVCKAVRCGLGLIRMFIYVRQMSFCDIWVFSGSVCCTMSLKYQSVLANVATCRDI